MDTRRSCLGAISSGAGQERLFVRCLTLTSRHVISLLEYSRVRAVLQKTQSMGSVFRVAGPGSLCGRACVHDDDGCERQRHASASIRKLEEAYASAFGQCVSVPGPIRQPVSSLSGAVKGGEVMEQARKHVVHDE